MTIGKLARDPHTYARPILSFPNARTAFYAWLRALELKATDEVLLPSFIGWSEREGSGVFDPVRSLQANHNFYRVFPDLGIDLVDLKTKLATGRARVLVLIHYFGYPDRNLHEVIKLARDYNVLVLEDEAHALYSDWVGGICGRQGDAAIMSLHKMLPFQSGGLLQINDAKKRDLIEKVRSINLETVLEYNIMDYDLFEIAAARRTNAEKLLALLSDLKGRADPLFPSLPKGVVPQTFPVVINGRSRDELYFELNDLGYGVVSLYHTLIEEISADSYPDSYWLSKRILNLPVHQDTSPHELEDLVGVLLHLLKEVNY